MRISDWSSDVCSSDLRDPAEAAQFLVHLAGDLGAVEAAVVAHDLLRPVLQQRRIEESRPEIERGQQVLAEVGEAPDAIGLHRQLRVVALERKVEVDDAFHEGSEEHTSELQSLMRISYAVFCLKKKKTTDQKK